MSDTVRCSGSLSSARVVVWADREHAARAAATLRAAGLACAAAAGPSPTEADAAAAALGAPRIADLRAEVAAAPPDLVLLAADEPPPPAARRRLAEDGVPVAAVVPCGHRLRDAIDEPDLPVPALLPGWSRDAATSAVLLALLSAVGGEPAGHLDDAEATSPGFPPHLQHLRLTALGEDETDRAAALLDAVQLVLAVAGPPLRVAAAAGAGRRRSALLWFAGGRNASIEVAAGPWERRLLLDADGAVGEVRGECWRIRTADGRIIDEERPAAPSASRDERAGRDLLDLLPDRARVPIRHGTTSRRALAVAAAIEVAARTGEVESVGPLLEAEAG